VSKARGRKRSTSARLTPSPEGWDSRKPVAPAAHWRERNAAPAWPLEAANLDMRDGKE